MNNRKTVKVIKRDARRQEPGVEGGVAVKKTTPEAARDVVATVTGWVSEFQQKRRQETAQALKTLFTDTTPQASKA